MKSKLYNAFALGIRPESKVSIVEWCKNVKLKNSERSDYCDLTLTPFLIEPLETILDNKTNYVCMEFPPGSGKTSGLMLPAISWLIANKPGPMLVSILSNEAAAELMETVLLPSFKENPLIKPLFPVNRHEIRKNYINFSSMSLWVGGANLKNFTSKSCQHLFLDEAFALPKGKALLKEFERRCHDRAGHTISLLSQSGVVKDEFYEAVQTCHKHDYNYKCKKCESYYPYEFSNLKWTVNKTESGAYIWESLVAHYECPCGQIYKDNDGDRKSLSISGKYIPQDSATAIPNRKAFHYNILAVYWVEWKKIAIEFLQANEVKKKGNFDLLMGFNQKRLCIPWDIKDHMVDSGILNLSDYTLEDAKTIRGDETLMGIDVQMDVMFWVIRTAWKNGESKLISHGVASTFEQLHDIQLSHGIDKGNRVCIDMAYSERRDEVLNACFNYKWIPLDGRGESEYYTVTEPKTKKKISQIYGEAKAYRIPRGIVQVFPFSSSSAKTVLFNLKAGRGCDWGVPSDVSADYRHQITSEYQIITGDGKIRYERAKNRNHLLDCENQILVMMIARKLYQHSLPAPKE